MDYGIKVSIIGSAVLTATDVNLVITSKRNCLKLKDVGHTTVTSNGTSGNATVAHGLSFPPLVIACISYASNNYILPWLDPSTAAFVTYKVDTTNVTFETSLVSAGTYDIYYYQSETESAT